MQFNIKSQNTQNNQDNNKLFVTLNDLIDDMEYENNLNSDIYQEKGEIYDKEKLAYDLKGNSGGRYTNKYIHAIMRLDGLEKFRLTNDFNKSAKSNKNGK